MSAHNHNSYNSTKPHSQNYKQGWVVFFRLTEISLMCLTKTNIVAIQHWHFPADNTYQVDKNTLYLEVTTRRS